MLFAAENFSCTSYILCSLLTAVDFMSSATYCYVSFTMYFYMKRNKLYDMIRNYCCMLPSRRKKRSKNYTRYIRTSTLYLTNRNDNFFKNKQQAETPATGDETAQKQIDSRRKKQRRETEFFLSPLKQAHV